jgi:Tol biopolymer transport system component
MNLDGTEQKRLTNDVYFNGDPSFSPDGEKIVFDKNGEIYVMDTDGSNQIRLTKNPIDSFVWNTSAVFSPDGTKIAFWSYPWNTICIINSDGSNQIYLTSVQPIGVPSFSPDGSQIVVNTYKDDIDANANLGEIYVISTNGTERKNLTNNAANDYSPSWSGYLSGK